MLEDTQGLWTRIRHRVRNRLVSGMLLLVPLGVTLLVMRWLFGWMAGFLEPVVIGVLKRLPISLEHPPGLPPMVTTAPVVPGMYALPPAASPDAQGYPLYVNILVSVVSILILLGLLYVVGVIGQLVLGRRLIAAGETILLKIPFARTVYGATKQVMQAVSLPSRSASQAVVLVDFPRPGWKALAFLTGTLRDEAGRLHGRVFIPTTPNPTTGFFEIVPADEVVQTSLTFEEAAKILMSGGILAPDTLELAHPTLAELEAAKATDRLATVEQAPQRDGAAASAPQGSGPAQT